MHALGTLRPLLHRLVRSGFVAVVDGIDDALVVLLDPGVAQVTCLANRPSDGIDEQALVAERAELL